VGRFRVLDVEGRRIADRAVLIELATGLGLDEAAYRRGEGYHLDPGRVRTAVERHLQAKLPGAAASSSCLVGSSMAEATTAATHAS